MSVWVDCLDRLGVGVDMVRLDSRVWILHFTSVPSGLSLPHFPELTPSAYTASPDTRTSIGLCWAAMPSRAGGRWN